VDGVFEELIAVDIPPGYRMISGHVTEIGEETIRAKVVTASISLHPSEKLAKGVQPVVSPRVSVCILPNRSKGT
jgi:hypothetical protein